MSWQAAGYVKGLTHSTTGEAITRGEKLILLLLADYTNPETGIANPSIPRLAEEGLYEKRQVLRIIEQLENKSFITVQRSSALFPGNNMYRIVGLTTKCHKVKPKVDSSPCDIDSDILPSKMSPEPNTNIEPIKSYKTSSLFSEQNPSELKQSSRNKHKEKLCDSRHAPVRAVIIGNYQRANGGDLPAWNGREAKRLSLFLDDHADWTAAKIITCVTNRFLSEENHAEDPIAWISKLAKYAAGPVDTFGKPLGVGNGKSKQEQRRAINRANITQGLRATMGNREDFRPNSSELLLGDNSGDD